MTTVRRRPLGLESLDDRLVPSATMLDLTHRGDAAAAGGAIVRQSDAQPTGSGNIHSFVRIQGAANGGGSEQGYNTDARPLQFDENKSPQFTRSLTLGRVPVVTVDGVRYREFLLDINQKSSSPYLSLDEVKVFVGGANLSGYAPASAGSPARLGGQTAAFDLDAAGDVSVRLDARLGSGSGAGDMTLLVPDAAFGGAGGDTSVYLYSKMGTQPGAGANGGFEEWAVRSVPQAPPPAATSSLAGSVFIDANRNGVRDAGEAGIVNVPIQLQGRDITGQTVVLTTTTAADGSYRFAGLVAGTYSIFETEQPFGLADGQETVGSLGGFLAPDAIVSIGVGANETGVDYNFAELPPLMPPGGGPT